MGSIISGDDNTGFYGDTIDETDHQKDQAARRTDCRQSIAAEKISNDQGIRRIV